jgi:hypothetical protein
MMDGSVYAVVVVMVSRSCEYVADTFFDPCPLATEVYR